MRGGKISGVVWRFSHLFCFPHHVLFNARSKPIPSNTCAIDSYTPIRSKPPCNQLLHTPRMLWVMNKALYPSEAERVSDLYVHNYCQKGKRTDPGMSKYTGEAFECGRVKTKNKQKKLLKDTQKLLHLNWCRISKLTAIKLYLDLFFRPGWG